MPLTDEQRIRIRAIDQARRGIPRNISAQPQEETSQRLEEEATSRNPIINWFIEPFENVLEQPEVRKPIQKTQNVINEVIDVTPFDTVDFKLPFVKTSPWNVKLPESVVLESPRARDKAAEVAIWNEYSALNLPREAKQNIVDERLAELDEFEKDKLARSIVNKGRLDREDFNDDFLGAAGYASSRILSRAFEAATGGVFAAETAEAQNLGDKVFDTAGTILGFYLGIKSTKAVLRGSLSKSSTYVKFAKKYPILNAHLLETGSFVSLGQLNPDLVGDFEARLEAVKHEAIMGNVFAGAGHLFPGKAGIPAQAALGFTVAKISGADDQQAFIDAGAFALMHGTALVGIRRSYNTSKNYARKTLEVSSEGKLPEKYTVEDVNKLRDTTLKKLQKEPPTQERDVAIQQVNNSAEFLTKEVAGNKRFFRDQTDVIKGYTREIAELGKITGTGTKNFFSSGIKSIRRRKGVNENNEIEIEISNNDGTKATIETRPAKQEETYRITKKGEPNIVDRSDGGVDLFVRGQKFSLPKELAEPIFRSPERDSRVAVERLIKNINDRIINEKDPVKRDILEERLETAKAVAESLGTQGERITDIAAVPLNEQLIPSGKKLKSEIGDKATSKVARDLAQVEATKRFDKDLANEQMREVRKSIEDISVAFGLKEHEVARQILGKVTGETIKNSDPRLLDLVNKGVNRANIAEQGTVNFENLQKVLGKKKEIKVPEQPKPKERKSTEPLVPPEVRFISEQIKRRMEGQEKVVKGPKGRELLQKKLAREEAEAAKKAKEKPVKPKKKAAPKERKSEIAKMQPQEITLAKETKSRSAKVITPTERISPKESRFITLEGFKKPTEKDVITPQDTVSAFDTAQKISKPVTWVAEIEAKRAKDLGIENADMLFNMDARKGETLKITDLHKYVDALKIASEKEISRPDLLIKKVVGGKKDAAINKKIQKEQDFFADETIQVYPQLDMIIDKNNPTKPEIEYKGFRFSAKENKDGVIEHIAPDTTLGEQRVPREILNELQTHIESLNSVQQKETVHTTKDFTETIANEGLKLNKETIERVEKLEAKPKVSKKLPKDSPTEKRAKDNTRAMKQVGIASPSATRGTGISALDGKIHIDGKKIVATDLDTSIVYHAEKGLGTAILDKSTFQKFSIDDIRISESIVEAGPHSYPNVTNKGDIAKIPEIKGDVFSGSIRTEDVRQAFEAKVASKDGVKPELNGVLIEGDGKNINIVSTDSFRLHRVSIPKETKPFEVILDQGPANKVARFLRTIKDATVDIKVDKAGISIRAGNFEFIGRNLISDAYPKYKELIPDKITNATEIVLSKNQLKQLVSSIPKETDFNSLKFTVDDVNKKLILTAEKEGKEIYRDSIDIEVSKGEFGISKEELGLLMPIKTEGLPENTIQFNKDYLKDFTKLSGEEIRIKFTDPKEFKPTFWESVGPTTRSQLRDSIHSYYVDGIRAGKKKNINLKLEKELQEKGFAELSGKKIESPKDVIELRKAFSQQSKDFENREHSYLAIVDKENNIRSIELDSIGTETTVNVNIGNKLFNKISRENGEGFYIIHNHPKGREVKHSAEDIKTHNRISKIASERGVEFKGSIILNGTKYAIADKKVISERDIRVEGVKEMKELGGKIESAKDAANYIKSIADPKKEGFNLTFVDSELNVTSHEFVPFDAGLISVKAKLVSAKSKNKADAVVIGVNGLNLKDPSVMKQMRNLADTMLFRKNSLPVFDIIGFKAGKEGKPIKDISYAEAGIVSSPFVEGKDLVTLQLQAPKKNGRLTAKQKTILEMMKRGEDIPDAFLEDYVDLINRKGVLDKDSVTESAKNLHKMMENIDKKLPDLGPGENYSDMLFEEFAVRNRMHRTESKQEAFAPDPFPSKDPQITKGEMPRQQTVESELLRDGKANWDIKDVELMSVIESGDTGTRSIVDKTTGKIKREAKGMVQSKSVRPFLEYLSLKGENLSKLSDKIAKWRIRKSTLGGNLSGQVLDVETAIREITGEKSMGDKKSLELLQNFRLAKEGNFDVKSFSKAERSAYRAYESYYENAFPLFEVSGLDIPYREQYTHAAWKTEIFREGTKERGDFLNVLAKNLEKTKFEPEEKQRIFSGAEKETRDLIKQAEGKQKTKNKFSRLFALADARAKQQPGITKESVVKKVLETFNKDSVKNLSKEELRKAENAIQESVRIEAIKGGLRKEIDNVFGKSRVAGIEAAFEYRKILDTRDIPELNKFRKDPITEMRAYANHISRRVPQVEMFGKDFEVLVDLVAKARENKELSRQEADYIVRVTQKIVNDKMVMGKNTGKILALNAYLLSPYTSIKQISQFIPIAARNELNVMVKEAMKLALSKDYRQQSQRRAVVVGAISPQNMATIFEGQYGSASHLHKRYYDIIGMSLMERWLRTTAVNTEIKTIEKRFGIAQKLNTKKSLTDAEKKELAIIDRAFKRDNLVLEDVLKRGKLTQKELEQAGFIGTKDTQFFAFAEELPAWARTTDAGRLFFQFRTYSYENIIKKNSPVRLILSEARHGNLMPLMIGLGGWAIMGEIARDLTNLLQFSEPDPDEGIFTAKRWLENLIFADFAMGMFGLFESASYGTLSFVSNLFGPTAGIVGDVSDAFVRMRDQENDLSDEFIRLTRKQVLPRSAGFFAFGNRIPSNLRASMIGGVSALSRNKLVKDLFKTYNMTQAEWFVDGEYVDARHDIKKMIEKSDGKITPEIKQKAREANEELIKFIERAEDIEEIKIPSSRRKAWTIQSDDLSRWAKENRETGGEDEIRRQMKESYIPKSKDAGIMDEILDSLGIF